MKIKNVSVAVLAAVALMAGGIASADEIRINPTTQNASPGATVNAAIAFVADSANPPDETTAFEILLNYNPAVLTITPTAANGAQECAVLVPGQIRLQMSNGANDVVSNTYCNLSIAVAPAAAPGTYPLDLDAALARFESAPDVPAPGTHTVTDGEVVVTAAPPATPPTLTFTPGPGTVVSGNNITITPSGGQAGGSATYTCTPAGGVIATNPNGVILTGGAPVSMNVSCPAGPDGSLSCTHTGGAGSTTSPVNYVIDCPAVPAAIVTPNPANGTPLACNGPAGSTQTTQVTITNTGNANITGLACSTTGAGFSIGTAPAATVAPTASTTVVASCVVPADGAPANTGTLNCTTTAPGTGLSYPLSSIAQSSAVPTQAAIVPASSLWSKIGLVGLLAALGMLVVGFRRQH